MNQVQLNLKAGLNFASALRAHLAFRPRHRPGKGIRAKRTAVIAIEAALTGHMVLGDTSHEYAASTPMRLIEMGLEPFLVTSYAVGGALAQRLARRLCMHCKQAYEPTEAEIVGARLEEVEEVEAMGGMTQLYRAGGCSACADTGYRGRKALAELLPMTEEIERVIIEGGSVDEIHRVGVSQGMTTLRRVVFHKALEGETTIEEVLRVVASARSLRRPESNGRPGLQKRSSERVEAESNLAPVLAEARCNGADPGGAADQSTVGSSWGRRWGRWPICPVPSDRFGEQ